MSELSDTVKNAFTLRVVEAFIESGDKDVFAELLMGFLNKLSLGPVLNDFAEEHRSGFAGFSFEDKDGVRFKFWQTAVSRCDTDRSLKAYVHKSFRNYISSYMDAREYRALGRIVNDALKSNDARQRISKRKHGGYNFYGLVDWGESVDVRGQYADTWDNIQSDAKKTIIDQISIRHASERRYERADIIDSCASLLAVVEKYCRASVLSRGISKFCVKFMRIMYENEMVRNEEGSEDANPNSLDNLAYTYAWDEWGLSDASDMTQNWLGDQGYQMRDLTIWYYRILENPQAPKTLHELGDKLGVSHVTVSKVEKKMQKEIREWLSQKDIPEQRDICRILPNVVKNMLERCL